MKYNICVLFGGVSPEHEVSLRSAESVLNNLNTDKYNIYPVGITKDGRWIYFAGSDYSLLPSGQWESFPENRKATISPSRDQGLVLFNGSETTLIKIDAVFPVLHGKNGEDGTVQGLLRLAGIPFVGPDVTASAAAMDKTMTKLVMDNAGIMQANWLLVRSEELSNRMEAALDTVEAKFTYPVFVKPAGTGSSVGISKAVDRATLETALIDAAVYDTKILVEEFINGREIEVAVMGNETPVASVCGEIESGAEFYDYEAKYVSDTSVAYIPARLSAHIAEQVRETAAKAYRAMECKGLSRVDFFVTYDDERVILNEINTLPGFTSISMYPKLFAASGIPYAELLDELLRLAMEIKQ